jgi:hypothetical protein
LPVTDFQPSQQVPVEMDEEDVNYEMDIDERFLQKSSLKPKTNLIKNNILNGILQNELSFDKKAFLKKNLFKKFSSANVAVWQSVHDENLEQFDVSRELF